MYRELQVHENKARNAMRKMKVAAKRGSLVQVDTDGQLKLATSVEGLRIANRGLNKLNYKSLNGIVSDYDVAEDTIAIGEFVAEVAMESGEQFAMQVAGADAEAIATAFPVGAFLEVTAGVFTKMATGSSRFVSRGVYIDNGHPLLIVEIL